MSGYAEVTSIQPLGYGVALTTVSILILSSNPTRRGLWFHNRGNNNIEIAPSPIAAGAAGSLLILPGAFIQFDGLKATCAWNGHMVTSTGDISILEWIA